MCVCVPTPGGNDPQGAKGRGQGTAEGSRDRGSHPPSRSSEVVARGPEGVDRDSPLPPALSPSPAILS